MERISSGSPWELSVGYSRAVVANGFVFVSATAATDAEGRVIGKGDLHRQAQAILEKLGGVLAQAGARFEDVVQVRAYVTDIGRWEEAARAHSEVFRDIRPALTLVHVKPFLDPDMLIEIELTAVKPG